MKILLINPPIRLGAPPHSFPIGLGIIAQVLVNEGYRVDILDINAERISKSELIKRINLKSKYDIIGVGGLITTYQFLKWLIPELRKYNSESKIIIGGGVVTETQNLLLNKTPADIAVIGEGEMTMKELVSVLEINKPLETVRGIVYKRENQIKINPPRPLIKNLDELPLPAYELFPTDIYVHNVWISPKKTQINVITARGCPYNCNYCFHIFGKGARTRSINNVIEEIKYLIDKYKVESLIIQDETFSLNKKRVIEFCNSFLREKIKIPWMCSCRVNLVDREMFAKMKQAGCYYINYGIESGSQKILDNMNKRVKVHQAKWAIQQTMDAGFYCGTTFMFGYPGEDLTTIKETINFCRELMLYPTFFYTTPYPGTKLFEEAKDRILKKFGDLDKFYESLGDALEFTINLTDFSDEMLFKLKQKTEKILRKIPYYKYPKFLYLKYKKFGLVELMRRILKAVKKKIVYKQGFL